MKFDPRYVRLFVIPENENGLTLPAGWGVRLKTRDERITELRKELKRLESSGVEESHHSIRPRALRGESEQVHH